MHLYYLYLDIYIYISRAEILVKTITAISENKMVIIAVII